METIGEVVALSGEVRALSEGGERILSQGSPIHEGETILTAQGSSIEIKLADESILAQGENASQTIDSFIYDPDNASTSNMLINMAQGTFRMVTGQVGKANPEGVEVKTPLATIGIRGTGIDLDVQGAMAKIGCFLYDGLDVTITTEEGTRFLTAVNSILDILSDGTFGELRTYSDFEKAFFKAAAPIIGVPEGDLYGDDDDGQEGSGGGDVPEGEGDGAGGEGEGEGDETGDGDGEQTPEEILAELFETIFGTEEQPSDLLQTLFAALTGEETGGDDTLQGGTGEDTLQGGDDDDDDSLPGGANTDEDEGDGGHDSSTSWTGNEDGSAFDTSDADNVIDGSSSANDHYGTGGADVIRAYGGDDTLVGQAANDSLFGGGDEDWLQGVDGDDLLIGGTGDDNLSGGNDSDELHGGDGSDFLDGGTEGDEIHGGTDSDIIYGNDDPDQLYGDAGDDYFLVMHSGSNADLEDFYRDFTPGEDMLVIDRALTNWTPTTDVTLNANFFVSSSTHADYVASNGDWAGVSGESMAPLVLDAEGNLYYDEYPHSGFGDTAEKIGHFSTVPDADSIVVATIHIDDLDAHLMVGDADYDFMIGLGGDDTLFGSGGSDTMYGGSGADAFKYTALSDGGQAGATGDKIIDFHHGEDYFTFTSGIFTVCDTVIAGDDTVPKNNVGFWTWGSAYDDSTTSGSYGDEGFIFDSNGDLWYDPNLGDMNDAVHIAHVEGEVTNEDIHLVP